MTHFETNNNNTRHTILHIDFYIQIQIMQKIV